MSELLDRIQREIRERLEASRAAVREHERLEAALHGPRLSKGELVVDRSSKFLMRKGRVERAESLNR